MSCHRLLSCTHKMLVANSFREISQLFAIIAAKLLQRFPKCVNDINMSLQHTLFVRYVHDSKQRHNITAENVNHINNIFFSTTEESKIHNNISLFIVGHYR